MKPLGDFEARTFLSFLALGKEKTFESLRDRGRRRRRGAQVCCDLIMSPNSFVRRAGWGEKEKFKKKN